jgi:sugar (pentulose or hexulose) kinase
MSLRTIGIDIGTSSVKGVLCEVAEAVAVLATASRPYNTEGRPTRDPGLWKRLALEACAELCRSAAPDAIGFTGQMHSLIAVDEAGELAAPVKLWLDMDGAPDLAAFVAADTTAIAKTTGNLPLPDFTLAKWLHASAIDPGLVARTARLYCAKDFVRAGFGDNASFVVDRNEAAGMQIFDPFRDHWDESLLTRAGLRRDMLPALAGACDIAGHSREGVPLVLGVGDQAAAARAIGSFMPGVVSVSLGTSGVLSFPISRQAIPASWNGDFHLFPTGFDDGFQIIGTVPAFGSILRWLAELTGRSTTELDSLAATVPPGSSEPVFLPYLEGAGAPHPLHYLRGELTGFSTDLTPGRLARAVYDGLAQEFAMIVHDARLAGASADSFRISGGAARLPELLRTLSGYLDGDASVLEATDGSAVGAALLAADALGGSREAVLLATPLPAGPRLEPSARWMNARQRLLTSRHHVARVEAGHPP